MSNTRDSDSDHGLYVLKKDMKSLSKLRQLKREWLLLYTLINKIQVVIVLILLKK